VPNASNIEEALDIVLGKARGLVSAEYRHSSNIISLK
jgi:hypothetical protein